MNHSPQDLEDRADRIQKAIASIQSTIEQIKAQGDIAPPGCCVLRYQARGNKKPYWYYKLYQFALTLLQMKLANTRRMTSDV